MLPMQRAECKARSRAHSPVLTIEKKKAQTAKRLRLGFPAVAAEG
jgi:hypothetical protein